MNRFLCLLIGVALSAVSMAACTPALEKATVIWPADGNVPASLNKQYVFLTADRRTAIIRFPPHKDGSPNEEILRIPIHNQFQVHVGTLIQQESEGLLYQYSLANSRKSEDMITDFSVVATPDEALRYGGLLWHGSRMPTANTKRFGLPDGPPGWLVLWVAREEVNGLKPGEKTKCVIRSVNKPGLTSAAFGNYSAFTALEEWPDEVFDQLGPVVDPSCIDTNFITIGPKYKPEETAEAIAADYLQDMPSLMKQKSVDAHSPFMEEVIEVLTRIKAGQAHNVDFHNKPTTQFEGELQRALELCFGVPVHEPK